MTKTLTTKQQDELVEVTNDILKNLLPKSEQYTVHYASLDDLKSVRRIQTRLAKLVSDLHPEPLYEWEQDDE